ncbi:cyclohexanecarboxylate-CoA ligase [Nocardia nova]|uniref:Cyclohexanecarboxylate-CoA ligase n=1 Tax=Nocardia nova TaxID=37330 RepID=A0A2S6AGN4_9NOCA|nr:AMP-binding protein [Nocardia nova]PPJ33942.1 cyclohexanecarboxylate-CoA ligase [Nocardia nova]
MSRDDVLAAGDTVWKLLERRVATSPGQLMFVDDRGVSWSFQEYRDSAEEVAAALYGRGIRAGMTVSWQLPTCLEAVIVTGALARLGVTQNPLLPVLREAELRPILVEVRPDLIIVARTWNRYNHAEPARDLAAEIGADVLVLELENAAGLCLPQEDSAALPPVPDADGPRWIYTSSGATARPKTIVHTDTSTMATAHPLIELLGVRSTDVFPIAFPMTHIGGMTWITATLRVGCSVVLHSTFDPVRTPLEMARHGATILGSATPFFHAYMAAQQAHGPEPLFPRLRFAVGGGAPTPPGLHARFAELMGGQGIFNGYGLTECPSIGYPVPGDPDELVDASVFTPGSGVKVRIIDPEDRPLPPGRQGELVLNAPQLFVRYLDGDMDSKARYAGEFVRTGDLAVQYPDGRVKITGRIKDIIIRNGENISASEVEAIVAGSPKVADVAVVGLPDDVRGERVCAVVVANDPADPPVLAEIIEQCRRAGLARFKHVEHLELVDALPRSPMGKLVKQEIVQMILPAAGRTTD